MILLDTHIVLWLLLEPQELSGAAERMIRQAEATKSGIAISAISLFEIATAVRRGRVEPNLPTQPFLAGIKRRFRVVPVSDELAIFAGQLPEPFHGDPMDRLIAATAIMENRTLITADSRILSSGVCKTQW